MNEDQLLDQLGGDEVTLRDLQQAMASGELTAVQLTSAYLARIARYDQRGPALNSVLELNPDAHQIAAALDRERELHGPRGPLHGIPVLLKDNLDTGDKMHTSAGTLGLAESRASEDATVARKLRNAGAVILGKTGLTEMANFMTLNMPNGYNARGGQVLNPYGPGEIDTGGSSSGSGAAAAANFCGAAVGTETSGSILSPSSQHNLVGVKPTVGLVSRQGIVPISHSQDTAGPMTRHVLDAALMLDAMAGQDPRDPATLGSDGRLPSSYADHLLAGGLQGARVGIPRGPYYERLDEDQLKVMEAAIEALRKAGAEVIDPAPIATANSDFDVTVLVYEFKATLDAYLAARDETAAVHSLEELIDYNQRHASQALKYGQVLLLRAAATSGTLTEPEYIEARLRDLRLSGPEGIDATMNEHQLDALVFPSNWGAGIAAKAGYPSITVPGGFAASGEPVGVTFTGLAWSEPRLFELAYSFEQATSHRRPPRLEERAAGE